MGDRVVERAIRFDARRSELAVNRRSAKEAEVDPKLGRTFRPLAAEDGAIHVLFPLAGRTCGHGRRLRTVEPECVEPCFDLRSALAELSEHRLGEAGDLEAPIRMRALHAVAELHEPGCKLRAIDDAGRLDRAEDLFVRDRLPTLRPIAASR